MKYICLLIVQFFCIKCSAIVLGNEMNFEMDDIVIPSEIVSNYVHQYLDPTKMFISIAFSHSNDNQKYVQEQLISKLLKNTKFNEFSNNILYNVHQMRRDTVNDFNVILVDGSNSLAWVRIIQFQFKFHLFGINLILSFSATFWMRQLLKCIIWPRDFWSLSHRICIRIHRNL